MPRQGWRLSVEELTLMRARASGAGSGRIMFMIH